MAQEPTEMVMPPAEHGRLSPWRDSGGIDDAQAREHAERLELRARAEDEIAVRDEYLGLLKIAAGERVLEVGCGSGAVTRALASRVVAAGEVVGVDASGALIEVARALAERAGCSGIRFEHADCRALPFPEGAFDAVLAVTTLSHVPQPDDAIREMVRVTRRGGRVGVFDIDGDSFLISHPDHAMTRRIVAAFSDHGLVNGWLMRSLAGTLRGLGFQDTRTRGFMPLDTGGYYAQAARHVADIAFQAGVVTSDERAGWLKALDEEFSSGRFVSGRLHLFVYGVKP
jgi:ubiquinone/menaquinone biosynthesis C-methylase UbiE